jgi:hypothetical protein
VLGFEFEIRVSHLIGQQSITWAIPLALEVRFSYMYVRVFLNYLKLPACSISGEFHTKALQVFLAQSWVHTAGSAGSVLHDWAMSADHTGSGLWKLRMQKWMMVQPSLLFKKGLKWRKSVQWSVTSEFQPRWDSNWRSIFACILEKQVHDKFEGHHHKSGKKQCLE